MLLTTDAVPAHERVGYWGDVLRERAAAHFSRMFRQRYGASPREWRRRGSGMPERP